MTMLKKPAFSPQIESVLIRTNLLFPLFDRLEIASRERNKKRKTRNETKVELWRRHCATKCLSIGTRAVVVVGVMCCSIVVRTAH